MKIHSIILSGLLALNGFTVAVEGNHGRYYAELQALKEAPETRMIFDQDANQNLARMQSSIISCNNLSLFDQIMSSIILMHDVIMVTPETMPLLHNYIESVCKKANMKVPFVFISRKNYADKSFKESASEKNFVNSLFKNQRKKFNGFAMKLLMTRGGVFLDQKAILELSDEGFEAVLTHELGHIRHNHMNKSICLAIMVFGSLALLKDNSETVRNILNLPFGFLDLRFNGLSWLHHIIAWSIFGLIINKRFEKEADAFSYADNGKAKGLIESFELMLKNQELREEEFAAIYDLLQVNKKSLSSINYYELVLRYYCERINYKFDKLRRAILEATPFGPYPSLQERIAAAQKHLAQQQQ